MRPTKYLGSTSKLLQYKPSLSLAYTLNICQKVQCGEWTGIQDDETTYTSIKRLKRLHSRIWSQRKRKLEPSRPRAPEPWGKARSQRCLPGETPGSLPGQPLEGSATPFVAMSRLSFVDKYLSPVPVLVGVDWSPLVIRREKNSREQAAVPGHRPNRKSDSNVNYREA